jgi:hypothetical protein
VDFVYPIGAWNWGAMGQLESMADWEQVNGIVTGEIRASAISR